MSFIELNLPETQFPHLHDERAVLKTSQDAPALKLWDYTSSMAFTGFRRMSPLGQGPASDIGRGIASRLVQPRPEERASSRVASPLPVFWNFLLQITGEFEHSPLRARELAF